MSNTPLPTAYACPLDPESGLHSFFELGDFLDCYAIAADTPARQAAEEIVAFPGWAQALVQLRSLLTSPFGLMQEGPGDGEKIGPFPIVSETPSEILLGFNDRHLDFRVAVRSVDGQVSLATWVRPHNFGGRAYLKAIMPFHILIVRDALRRVARDPSDATGAANAQA